jgi:hypothetical protein
VARRISDRYVLALIEQWLVAPVEEDDGGGRRKRTTQAKDTKRGIPQGAPISPLLSNLYMRRFLLGWKTLGLEARLQARIVNFADDFVICCRGTGEQAMEAMRTMMDRLKLTVNEEKTGRCPIPQEHFDFLGYTFGRCYSPKTGRAHIGTRPSKKSIQKVCRTISEATNRRRLLKDSEDQVIALNRILVGWANYFSLGPVSKAYRAVDSHVTERLRRWLCKKHKRPGQGTARYPDEHLYDVLGLQRLSVRTRNLPWAKALHLVRALDAGNPHVQCDERRLETGSWSGLRHRHGRKPPTTATPRNLWLPRQSSTLPGLNVTLRQRSAATGNERGEPHCLASETQRGLEPQRPKPRDLRLSIAEGLYTLKSVLSKRNASLDRGIWQGVLGVTSVCCCAKPFRSVRQ